MPGRHVTDHQMRLFMQFRQTDTVAVAAAKASFSTATSPASSSPGTLGFMLNSGPCSATIRMTAARQSR